MASNLKVPGFGTTTARQSLLLAPKMTNTMARATSEVPRHNLEMGIRRKSKTAVLETPKQPRMEMHRHLNLKMAT